MTLKRWISFDVGETLIDETRVWSVWASLLGITPFTFMATLGAVIARKGDHREVFGLLGRPDWEDHRAAFDEKYAGFREEDLYADAVPALDALRTAGYGISVFANQPGERTAELRFLGVRPNLMAMSAEWGVSKPSVEFYARALSEMGAQPSDVAYVGDRLDNDVRPSADAGMRPVWIRRGPWGFIERDAPPDGTLVVQSLSELVERIDEVWR